MSAWRDEQTAVDLAGDEPIERRGGVIIARLDPTGYELTGLAEARFPWSRQMTLKSLQSSP